MSPQGNQEELTPQQFWSKTHEANTHMRLNVTEELGSVVQNRIKEITNAGIIALPKNIVEIGSGDRPFAADIARSLLPLTDGKKTQTLNIFLTDPHAYKEHPEVRFRARNAILFPFLQDSSHLPNVMPQNDSDVPPLGKPITFPVWDKRQITMEFSDKGIPGITIPERFNEFNGVAVSVFNYIPNIEDIKKFIAEPRMRTFTLVNGSGLGTTQAPDVAVRSTLELIELIDASGFIRLDTVFQYYEGNDPKYAEFAKAPIFGMFMVRPETPAEAEWLTIHQTPPQIIEMTGKPHKVRISY